MKWSAATAAEAVARNRLEETRVERDAIAQNVFVGDSYNDSPSSEQRATELRLRKGRARRRARGGAVSDEASRRRQIAEEEARYRQRSEATVRSCPPRAGCGRLWSLPARICEQGPGSLSRALTARSRSSARMSMKGSTTVSRLGVQRHVPAARGRQNLPRDGRQSDRGRGGVSEFRHPAAILTEEPLLRDGRNG